MDSNIDFADVFGGPPRRSSRSDSLRRSHADSLDSLSWRGSGSGYGSRPGSGVGEKPVFGEVSSPSRRRHLKDDFFSDIFGSGESASSSPRKVERDSMNSVGVLSPTRPLPPVRGEVLAVSTPLSVSMKLAKGIDPTLSSPTRNAPYKDNDGSPDTLPYSPASWKSIFPKQTVNAQDDPKIDGHVSYRQSRLSREISDDLDKSSKIMDSTGVSIKSHSQKDPTSLESYISKGQFHFSIYKWAGKGAALVMPSESNLQQESRFRRLPEIVVQEVDMILHEDNMSTLTTTYNSLSEDISAEDKDDSDLASAKHLPTKFEAESLHREEVKKSDIWNSNKEEVPVTIQEAQKHESKATYRLFDDDLDKQQNEEIIQQVEGKEDFSRGRRSVYENIDVKQPSGKENRRNPPNVTSPTMRDVPVPPEEKMGSRVKGKVKDFIKIFNQEPSPKRKGTFETPSLKSRGKDEGKIQDRVFVSTDKAYEQVKHTSRSNESTLPGTPVSINHNLEATEKVYSHMSFDVHMLDDAASEKSDPLRQFSDSIPDILDASVCDVEESQFEDIEVFLVEPLSHDQTKDVHNDSHEDQIKSITDKVRQWSKGKEGNIRSLLSTLQYVLWPESGWKPVPLVNIIDGSSVKRAYQRALLSLHPDKLQQKGASEQQKYTAAKVFDILQEAWDHFNSMTQI